MALRANLAAPLVLRASFPVPGPPLPLVSKVGAAPRAALAYLMPPNPYSVLRTLQSSRPPPFHLCTCLSSPPSPHVIPFSSTDVQACDVVDLDGFHQDLNVTVHQINRGGIHVRGSRKNGQGRVRIPQGAVKLRHLIVVGFAGPLRLDDARVGVATGAGGRDSGLVGGDHGVAHRPDGGEVSKASRWMGQAKRAEAARSSWRGCRPSGLTSARWRSCPGPGGNAGEERFHGDEV